jgi:hypothetical protein
MMDAKGEPWSEMDVWELKGVGMGGWLRLDPKIER